MLCRLKQMAQLVAEIERDVAAEARRTRCAPRALCAAPALCAPHALFPWDRSSLGQVVCVRYS